MNYITKQGDKHITQFKYKGSSLSLSYKYIWSPLAQQLLKITPKSIAPNTITLTGFIINIIATIILCLQLPYGSEAPKWSVLLFGFSVFLYQTLDNLDGKQARRIKNSTPLGMMMDHGCDALTVLTLSAGLARVVCLDNSTLFVWCLLAIVFSFYITAWCQYYSNGVMVLGKFNGVDEGLPAIWIVSILTGILGQHFWKIPITFFGLTASLNEIFLMSIVVSSIIQIYSVITLSGQQFTKDVKRAVFDLIHCALIIGTIFLITFLSDILESQVVGLVLGLTFTMARTISYTLLCSVTQMKFQQFQPSVIVFTLAYSFYVLFLQKVVEAEVVVYGIMAFAVVQYCVFVVSVMSHIADLLQISVFKVFKPKDQ